VYDGGGFASVNADALGATTTQPRTITMWVNPSAVPFDPGNSGLISKYLHFDVGQSNFYASLYQRGDGSIVTRLTGNGTDVTDVTAGTLNEWQHYVAALRLRHRRRARPSAHLPQRRSRRLRDTHTERHTDEPASTHRKHRRC
jgi:hypothetical protein